MKKSKNLNAHIPMGSCDVIVYSGNRKRRAVVYRQSVHFDPDILSKGFRGLISSEDILTYKKNTIDEYVSDTLLTIQKSNVINPEICVIFNSYKEEDCDISIDDVYDELKIVETETEEDILKEKLIKHFGE